MPLRIEPYSTQNEASGGEAVYLSDDLFAALKRGEGSRDAVTDDTGLGSHRAMQVVRAARGEPSSVHFGSEGQSLEAAALAGVPESRRTYTEKGGEATVTLVTARVVKTLGDLLEACDMDGEEWEVLDWEASAWNAPVKDAAQEVRIVQLHRVKARFKRKVYEPAIRDLAAGILADIASGGLVYPAPEAPSGEHLLVLAIPDLHLGKEAGDWSMETARETYMTAVEDLLRKAAPFGVGRICLPVGNDALQTDGSSHTTTRGTAVEYVGRWTEQFRAFTRLWREAAEMCASVAPVDLLFIRGNHDHDAVFYAGEVAQAVFSHDGRVGVRNEVESRTYYTHGKTLLGFTHGDKAKLADLAIIMATETPEAWASSSCREWHTGHLHHKMVNSTRGVVARISPALCPPDAWHRAMGYVGSLRGAEAVLYHPEAGRVAEFAYAVPS